MSDTSRQGDRTKPAAMAIPKGGFFEDKVERGRYGPIFPKTPACYGFSIIAKIIPGREPVFYELRGLLLPHIKMAPALMTRTGRTPIWLTDGRKIIPIPLVSLGTVAD